MTAMIRLWLMKSEPGVFSIDDLARARDRAAGWDGVRNYQARNFLKAMRKGDRAFFYHSSVHPPAVVGTVEVVREAYPDPSQFDKKSAAYDPAASKDNPRWFQVDVRLLAKFKNPVGLEAIKSSPELRDMPLLRHSRLSVQPVTPRQWKRIEELAGR